MLPYAITIFISAFLLFQVQLLLAKAILPWFGGAASVWTTCMLFFQTLLLIGYSYAHWLAQRPHLATQGRIHLFALAVSTFALILTGLAWGAPLLPDGSWKPGPEHAPVWHILLLLGVAVGLPYLVLSSTGPLLQAWFSRRAPGRSPYRLYALSNFGSLLGLLTYPFLIEVFVPLRGQAWIWTGGFALFTAGMGWIAWRLTQADSLPASSSIIGSAADSAPRPGARQRLLWLALPACASVLLLAITNQMSQEIAVNPFLWMLPLCLYLASFILCFDSERWYWREVYLFLLIPALAMVTVVLVGGVSTPVLAQIGVLSGALFIVCMVCHGELVRLKPAPRHLTAFYLTLTAGGAVGGVFVGLLAPVLFNGFFELPIALWLTAALLFAVLWRESGSPLHRLPVAAAVGALVTAVLLVAYVSVEDLPAQVTSTLDTVQAAPLWPAGVALGALALATVLWKIRAHRWWRAVTARPVWLASLLVFGIAQLGVALTPLADAALTTRNFYGVVQVLVEKNAGTDDLLLSLRHGRILHGHQYVGATRRHELGGYYHPRSGIGLALLQHPRRRNGEAMHVGVIGLGAGMLAAYGRAGDRLRFYEINPQVIRLAASPDAPFTYVRDTPARVEVVAGDARLALDAELLHDGPQGFDVLAVDAFSSDSIPIHLLTREAVALYLAHLAPNGVLAIHVSNRYLDLVPIVWRIAQHFELTAAVIDADGDRDSWHSTWVLLARDAATLQAPEIAGAAVTEIPRPAPLWRDDYSNLFQALHFAPPALSSPLADL